MCGTFGYELDISTTSEKEKALFREQTAVYRSIAPIVRQGDMYRLWNPFKGRC
jgi:alpha-galactosidase